MHAPLHDVLDDRAARSPTTTALVCGDRRVTFADLNDGANRLANALLAQGVQPGDRVAVLLENSVEAVVSIFGILKAGAAFTLLSPTTKPEKLDWILRDEAAVLLITANDGPRRRAVGGIALDGPRRVVWVGGLPEGAGPAPLDWDRLLDEGPAVSPTATVSERAIGTIIYTSGTTGDPKGVVSLHRDMAFATWSINEYLGNGPGDVIFCSLSLAFTYGLYQLFTAVAAGATLVLEKNFTFPVRALEVMERERVTGFPGVPTMYSLLLRLQNLDGYDLGSLRYLTNAAAPMPVEMLRRVRAAFPQAEMFSMYGQTECKRACYLPPEQLDVRPDSVGIPIPGTTAYVADERGIPVPPGCVGELVLVGDHLMAGYWNNPEQTSKRLRRGRTPGERAMFTGDLFRTDAEGFLYFVSRVDDLINTRGEKVSPNEVENVVRRMRGVADVAAIGVPDDVLGEAVKVFVVAEPGAAIEARDVRRHCAAHLEEFMVPRHVEFCSELPKSENGKVLRKDLRECVA